MLFCIHPYKMLSVLSTCIIHCMYSICSIIEPTPTNPTHRVYLLLNSLPFEVDVCAQETPIIPITCDSINTLPTTKKTLPQWLGPLGLINSIMMSDESQRPECADDQLLWVNKLPYMMPEGRN